MEYLLSGRAGELKARRALRGAGVVELRLSHQMAAAEAAAMGAAGDGSDLGKHGPWSAKETTLASRRRILAWS
eukprot:357494-Chlamydomonas_euryale.AAC.4